MAAPIRGFRLSPQQRRLWLLQDVGAQPCTQCVQELDGAVDAGSLEAAVAAVVAEHEALRTVYRRAPGIRMPVQTVLDEAPPAWRRVEASPSDADAVTERAAAEEVERRFDPAEGPMLRACFVDLGDGAGRLILTAPALACDAGSLAPLVAGLAAAWAGEEGAAEDERVQYLQFAEWQNELREEAGDGEEAGLRLRYRLPYERSTATGWPAAEARVPLGAEAAAAVAAVAERFGASPEVVVLAAWRVVLGRLGPEVAPAVGVRFATRRHEELSGVVGPLAKTLPIEIPVAADAGSFGEVVRAAARAHAAAEERQDDFFWSETDDPETVPRCDAGFAWSEPPEPVTADGLRFTPVAVRSVREPFLLELRAVARGDALELVLAYDPRRLEDADARRIAAKTGLALEALTADPVVPPERVDLMTDDERRELVVELNRTERELPLDRCAHELIAEQARRTPDAVAVEFEGQELTYWALDEQAEALAGHLRGLGVEPGTSVGIFLDRTLELPAALLGIWKAGGAYVPLDPLYPPDRLEIVLEETRASVVVTARRLIEALPPSEARVVVLDRDALSPGDGPAGEAGPEATPDDLAYVLYTSGSTGRPKGVAVHHRGLVNYLSWAAEAYELEAGNGAVVHSPIGFDLTVTGLFAPLLVGQRIVIVAEERGIEGLSGTLAAGRGFSLVKLTPSHLAILNELLAPEKAEGSVRRLVVGGEALDGEALEFWRRNAPKTRVVNEYGPTETVVGCVVHEAAVADLGPGPVAIGRPIANTRVYALDEDLRPVSIGVTGELWVGGAGVARGYLDRPRETAERFQPDPFSQNPGDRLYRTGDRVRFRVDGELEFVGRADEQVKVRGYRIEPGEVEAALLEHPAVGEAVVAAREDAAGEPRLVAYLVAGEDDETPSLGELRAFLLDRLPEPMIPTAAVRLDELPLTPNGKLDREALPVPGSDRPDLESVYVAPRTPAEEVLTALWEQVLGVDRIGIDDGFFALGGDSIRSVRAVALAKERGYHCTVEELFEHQTARELAQVVRSAETRSLPPVRTRPFELVAETDRAALPEGVEDAYPLTTLQEGMLYHMALTPDTPAYHNVNTWHIRAPYDYELFLQAVERVVARHPVLRTSFDLVRYSQPLQLVHRKATLSVGSTDLRDLPPEERREVLESFWETERRDVFDFTKPPYVRFHIHRRTDESFQFTLTESHAVLDGWSTTSTLAEIFELYLVLLKQETPRAERPLATSFRDFVHMERRALESDEHRRFWDEILDDAPVTRLPRWPSYPKVDAPTDVRKVAFDFPEEVVEGVRRVGRTAAVPLKDVLLAVHLKVLAVVTGRSEVMTGLVTNGRPEQLDGDRVRGLFLNTVPLRFRLSDGSWSELVREAFDAERELLPYRRFPVAELQRKWGRQPLYEVAFTFLNFHSVENLLRSGEVEVLEDDEKDLSFASFVLNVTFFLSPVSSNLRLLLEYDANQLAPEQIEQMRRYYERAMELLGAQALESHRRHPIVSEDEQGSLLTAWRGPEAGAGELLPQRFEAQAARTPDTTAVTDGWRSLTYRELDAAAGRVARRLQSRGVGPESVVALLLSPGVDELIALLGTHKAAAAYLPIDLEAPPARLAGVLNDSGALGVIAHEDLIDRLPEDSPPVWPILELSAEGEAARARAVDPDHLAYVLYTSGSTGRPKGSLVTHRGLANYLDWAVERYRPRPDGVSVVHSPLAFDLTVTALLTPLLAGGTVERMAGDPGLGSLAEALASRDDVDLLKVTPGQLDVLARQLDPGDSSVGPRVLVIGGEKLTAERLDGWRSVEEREVYNEYGPTETVVGCIAHRVGTGTPDAGTVPIGRPIAGVRILLLDELLQPAPTGASGEIYVGGAGLSRGYLGLPGLTAERFVPDPLGVEPGGRLYRTGDLALGLPDGELVFLDRIDRQVKVRGHRIELGELEVVLREHPELRDAVVDVRRDEEGERLVAYYVPREEGEPVTVTELRSHLREKLPDSMLPTAYVPLIELPLNVHGKVDRRALPAPAAERPELSEPALAPQTPLEETIATVWGEVLRLDEVGIRDNFFELGGDSLLLLRAYSKLRGELDRDFPMTDLFRHPTIEALAQALGDGDTDAAPARLSALEAGRERLERQRRQLERLNR